MWHSNVKKQHNNYNSYLHNTHARTYTHVSSFTRIDQ